MRRTLIVECELHQTRVALFEDDTLVEVYLESPAHRSLVGNIYKGRVNRVLPGMQAAFVQIGLDRDGYLHAADAQKDRGKIHPETGLERPTAIEDLLVEGQELIVQVRKEPLLRKGARLTTQVSLPGRHLVLLPEASHVGVSRRIDDSEEEERLRELAQAVQPDGWGLIVRTEAEGRSRKEIEADVQSLCRLWEEILTRAESVAVPALVHQDLDLAQRAARDMVGEGVGVVWVDSAQTQAHLQEQLARYRPDLLDRVKIDETGDARQGFRLDVEVEAALESRVWLRSGGYLIISPTEALVAIDVNTGRYVGRNSLEETVLNTNLEAAVEVARQIRLRDLGGIIVIDLIDMAEEEHRRQVMETLERELERDRAKVRMLDISEFGLVQITRKRSRSNLRRALMESCPVCHGDGDVRRSASDVRRG